VWVLPSNISQDLKEEFADRYDVDPIYRGTNSGFFALVVAGLLGCNPIAMIGMNLCLEGLGPEPAMGEWRVITTDPFGNLVNTHLEWFSARTELIELIERLEKNVGVTVFNCSEGGILYMPGLGLPLEKFRELRDDG